MKSIDYYLEMEQEAPKMLGEQATEILAHYKELKDDHLEYITDDDTIPTEVVAYAREHKVSIIHAYNQLIAHGATIGGTNASTPKEG